MRVVEIDYHVHTDDSVTGKDVIGRIQAHMLNSTLGNKLYQLVQTCIANLSIVDWLWGQ